MSLHIEGTPVIRVTTRPNDANFNGDIFGGWLMSQIDIAGAVIASEYAKGTVVTVAVKDLRFLKPLFVHDLVSLYGKVISAGKTSMTVEVQVYAQRLRELSGEMIKVADSTLVYVAVSAPGKKRNLG